MYFVNLFRTPFVCSKMFRTQYLYDTLLVDSLETSTGGFQWALCPVSAGAARGHVAQTVGSILLLLQQKPAKELALLKMLWHDEAGGRSALQGWWPSWHAGPLTQSELETPTKVEPHRKAVIGSNAKKSLRMLLEQYKKKEKLKPTALKKPKYESSDEGVCSGEQEGAEQEEEESEGKASSGDEPTAPTQNTKDGLKSW